MKSVIRFIPNLLTLANLASGFLALVCVAREEMVTAVWLFAIALLLDFLDGFAARILNANSALGKELDSLADMVTFGLLPGYILFQMIIITEGYYFVELRYWGSTAWINASVAALVPVAAAYRLAKYNLAVDSSRHFKGLPTPAMALCVMAIPLVLEGNYNLNFYHRISPQFVDVLADLRRWDPSDVGIINLLFKTSTYQIMSVVLAFLMASNIPMLSLKFKGISWSENKWSYGLIIWAGVSYIIFVIPYLLWVPLDYGLIDYLVLPIFLAGYFILSGIYATFGTTKVTVPSDEIQS